MNHVTEILLIASSSLSLDEMKSDETRRDEMSLT